MDQLVRNDVSSTKVRMFIRKGLSVEYLIPQVVVKYIKDHGLYQSSDRKRGTDSARSSPAPAAEEAERERIRDREREREHRALLLSLGDQPKSSDAVSSGSRRSLPSTASDGPIHSRATTTRMDVDGQSIAVDSGRSARR